MDESCITCGTDNIQIPKPELAATGIIYVRKQVNVTWDTHPQCLECFKKENPQREPVLFLIKDEDRIKEDRQN